MAHHYISDSPIARYKQVNQDTYGYVPQGQFDILSILHTLYEVLNDIVAEGEGKCLQRKGIC